MAEAILLPQPKVDLSGYSLTSHNHDTVYSKLAHDHTGVYAPNVHTHSQYLTAHQDLSGYSLVGHTHSQYLTAHQSLAGYATQDWVKANTKNEILGQLLYTNTIQVDRRNIPSSSSAYSSPIDVRAFDGYTRVKVTINHIAGSGTPQSYKAIHTDNYLNQPTNVNYGIIDSQNSKITFQIDGPQNTAYDSGVFVVEQQLQQISGNVLNPYYNYLRITPRTGGQGTPIFLEYQAYNIIVEWYS